MGSLSMAGRARNANGAAASVLTDEAACLTGSEVLMRAVGLVSKSMPPAVLCLEPLAYR